MPQHKTRPSANGAVTSWQQPRRYELIVTAEAVNALPTDLLADTSNVPKAAIIGMHLAAHEYHSVGDGFVWDTVDVDLPAFRDAAAELNRLGC